MVLMRKIAGWTGALLLGLPVALLAHMATYGGEHVVGGAEHGFVVATALLVASLAAVIGVAATVLSSRHAQSGSVSAARIGAYLPAWLPLALTAFAWFWGVERLESSHVVFSLPIILGLALVAWLTVRGARAVLRGLAGFAVAWYAPGRSGRGFTALRLPTVAPVATPLAPLRRRFARPPPLALA